LSSMSKISLISFAIGGAFLSLAYWDMPYYIMVILLCTERLVVDSLAAAPFITPGLNASPGMPVSSDHLKWVATARQSPERG